MSSNETTVTDATANVSGQAAYKAFGGGCAWGRLGSSQQGAWERAATAAAKVACAAEISKSAALAARVTALEAEIDEANATVASLSATRDDLEQRLRITEAANASLVRTATQLREHVAAVAEAVSELDELASSHRAV